MKRKKSKRKLPAISKFMDADHAHLNNLLDEFLNEKNNVGQSLKLFKKFQRHLMRHEKLEDNFLFPRLNGYLGLDKHLGPTALAQRDHVNIIKLMKLIQGAGKSKNFKKMKAMGQHLQRAINKHLRREQKIQYSICDSFISRTEWEQILLKIYNNKTSHIKK